MSKVLKLAVGIAFILSVISVTTSLMLAAKQMKYRDQMEASSKQVELNKDMQASINKKIADFDKVIKEKKELQKQVDAIKEELDTTSEKMQDLQNQLAVKDEEMAALREQTSGSDEGKVMELIGNMEKLKSDLASAEAKIAQEEEKRKSVYQKIDELSSQVEDKDTKLSEARKRESDLLTLVSMLKSQVSQLKSITEQKKDSDVKVEAPIEVINEELMFIVFDMGSKNGVRQDDVLKVFRGEDFLGLVTVIEVFPNKAAASISHKLIENNIGKDCVVRK
ncbi:MAG: hypothetical protein RBU23_09005 [Candidatus Auribacterota bacterium]|jgi:chromosome segregation ATPase|nr:hypothetical protein [Candidatus Auribacterota bacterium]